MKEKILDEIYNLLKEAERLYESNNHGAYEAGRIDGVKWVIDIIEKMD